MSSSRTSRTTRGPSVARNRTASSFDSPAPACRMSSRGFAGRHPAFLIFNFQFSIRLRLRRRLCKTSNHVRPALDVFLDLDDVVVLRVLEQIAERVVPVVLLVERRLLALHRLFAPRARGD